MVTDGGASYAAKKDVPANTALTNTEYWQKLVDTVAGVEIGDTATYASTELLFNPEGTNEHTVPEVDDDSVSEGDTWSSSKINGELQELKDGVALLSVIARKQIQFNDYAEIKRLVQTGGAKTVFNIGDQIPMKWSPNGTTEYDMPWDVVDIAPVINADGDEVPGLWLQSHWALPGLQFDASEALYYTESGLPADTYHFTIGTAWGNNCVAGKVYQFTLTQPVPAGGQICVANGTNFYTWGAPDVSPTNWKIYTFGAFSTTPVESGVSITEGNGGTDLGTTTSAIKYGETTGINNLQRAAYGYNRDSHSAMFQWLNSAEDAGGWQVQKNPFDRPAQQLATMRGFMAGLPSDFLNAVGNVQVTTALNTVSDSQLGTSETYNAKFFLASLEQEYVNPQLANVEGKYWPYWKERLDLDSPQGWHSDHTNANHIRYLISNHNSAQYVRFRSCYRGYSNGVWYVHATGNVSSHYATYAHAPAPACVIC